MERQVISCNGQHVSAVTPQVPVARESEVPGREQGS
jgi:hypothetical protein